MARPRAPYPRCFAIVKTCRSSGDNHGHRNANAGDAAETLPE
jgi:hypothetical protein